MGMKESRKEYGNERKNVGLKTWNENEIREWKKGYEDAYERTNLRVIRWLKLKNEIKDMGMR